MASQACLQLWTPGGPNIFNGAAQSSIQGVVAPGSLVADLTNVLKKANWADQQIGGLTTATFELYYPYETVNTIKAGSWVYFGVNGGQLQNSVAAGTSSITVTNSNFDAGGSSVAAFLKGDYVMISDGVNTDLMKVSNAPGLDPVALTLTSLTSSSSAVLMNSYAAGTKVTLLKYTGKVLSRPRKADLIGSYGLTAIGFVDRYNNVCMNSDITAQDSGFAIQGVLSSYAPTLPEIIVDPNNLIQNTGYLVGDHQTDGQVMTCINNMMAMENSSAPGDYFALWVDASRQIFHKKVIVQYGATYGASLDLQLPNAYGDIMGELATTDEDIRNLINAAIITGGTMADGTQLRIIVQDTTSINLYGYYEGTFSNTELYDEATASLWGAASLLLTAYPSVASSIPFKQTQARLTARDRVIISNFDDGSIMQLNVTSISYQYDAATNLVTGTVQLAQVLPSLPQAISGVNKRPIRRMVDEQQKAALNNAYVVTGFNLTVH